MTFEWWNNLKIKRTVIERMSNVHVLCHKNILSNILAIALVDYRSQLEANNVHRASTLFKIGRSFIASRIALYISFRYVIEFDRLLRMNQRKEQRGKLLHWPYEPVKKQTKSRRLHVNLTTAHSRTQFY